MRTAPLLAITLISIAIFHAHCPAEDSATACRKKLTIGVSLPLSVMAVSSGEAVRNSIILADEKYDQAQCVNFIFEDDQLLAKNTLSIVNRFIDLNHIDGLIVYGTPTSLAVGEIVEKNKLPMIALSILGRVVKDKQYIVKHWCAAERLNETVGREVHARGYKSVAIVSTQNEAMLRDLYVQSRTSDVVVDDEYVREATDFRSSILKIIAKKADAVYVLLFPPQTAVFMRQLREQGYKGEAFGVHNIEDPAEVAAAAGAMQGMWLANGDETAGENYRAEYLKRFGRETALGGASGFDAAKLFIEGAHQSGELNSWLHSVKGFHGAFGTYNATPNNDFDFGAVIKVVEPDGFRKITGPSH